MVKKTRFNNLSEITKEWKKISGIDVSSKTTLRRLNEMGYHSRTAKKKPLLTNKQKLKRLAWAKKHQSWTIEQWREVIWTDESRFCISFGDKGPKVWRQKGEEFLPSCLKTAIKHPGSYMVWGSMAAKGVGMLIGVEGNIDSEKYQDVLHQGLLPLIEPDKILHGFTFQQDLAPCNSSKSTSRWFEEFCIGILEWPGNSPDLNPLENLWRSLKKHAKKRCPRTKNDLIKILHEEWAKTQ